MSDWGHPGRVFKDAGNKAGAALNDAGHAIDDTAHDVVKDPASLLNPFWSASKYAAQEALRYLINVPKQPDYSREREVLITRSSNVAKVPVLYGKRQLGGICVFQSCSGTKNEYLWQVIVFCEGEIEAIDTVYIDKVASTDPKFGTTVQITKYTGTPGQAADAGLIAAFPGVWTADHKLSGLAYVVARFTYNPDIYSGSPSVTVDARGRKLYDPRTGTTAYKTNAALAVLDYLTNKLYSRGVDIARVDVDSFKAAANTSDIAIPQYTGGPNMVQFECNGVVDTNANVVDNLQELLSACRGYLVFTAGLYKLVIDQDGAPVYDFNPDNIIGAWSFASGNKQNWLNRGSARYCNPDKNWDSDLAIEDSPELRALDNGLLLDRELSFPYETSYYRALYHAEVAVKRSRQGITVSFVASPDALRCEVASIVTVTHPTPGWNGKLFRITALTLQANGLVAVQLQEHEPSVYDRTVPVAASTPPDTNLPDFRDVAPPVGPLVLLSGDDQLEIMGDGTVISRIEIGWGQPADAYIIGYEVDYKRSADPDWLPAARLGSQTETVAFTPSVIDRDPYDIRVRSKNSAGYYSDYLTQGGYVVIGKSAKPPPPTNFLFEQDADGTRRLSWDPPAILPADVRRGGGFQIRYALGSSGDYDTTMQPLHKGLLTAWPYEFNALAAGIYSFGIATIDSTGNESDPVYILGAPLGDPRLSDALAVQQAHVNGWPGTKTNCFLDPTSGWLLATDQKTWDDLTTDGITWDNWHQWTRNPNTIVYTDIPLDLGLVTQFTPLLSAEYSGTATLEIRTSNDGASYSAYAAPAGQVTARFIQARATVAPISNGFTALKALTLLLDGKTQDETINDLVTSALSGTYRIGAGHIYVPITKTYSYIRNINVMFQNVGPGWSWEVINMASSPGPEIKLYDSTHTAADAKVSIKVEGIP